MEKQVQCQDSEQVVAVDEYDYDKPLELILTHENLMTYLLPLNLISKEHSNYAPERPKWENLKHLKIRLSDIIFATDSFSKANLLWTEGHHQVYKAELEHFDQETFTLVEENNKSEVTKRRTTHHNIVTLLGFCDEDFELILVFENTSNKLSSYLKDTEKPILTWAECLRICLDVAYGLRYLHYGMEAQKVIIHRDISSDTIALDGNLGAQIAKFGKSVFLPSYLDDHTLYPDTIIGCFGYGYPEYMNIGKLNRESNVYSFGVILYEILCGKVIDLSHYTENEEEWVHEVRRCFHDGTIKDMVDPIIKEESGDIFALSKGPNKNSMDAFLKIVDACLVEIQDKRPTINVVIEELEKALMFQAKQNETNKIHLINSFRSKQQRHPQVSLEDIELATKNFHVENCVGGGGFGKVYKGKIPHSDNIIVAKQLDTTGGQGDKQFRNELQILVNYKHDNIISLVDYCDEKDAKIIVYEYAIRGSLDRHLNDSHLTWTKRLSICIDVASALDFLHGGDKTLATVIHRDIKPDNILLTGDWKAKLGDFGLSLTSAINNETDFVIDHACGTEGYVDPLYMKSRFLTKESDIYLFGVVLFEILCGRSTFDCKRQEHVHLSVFIKDVFEKGKGDHDEIVFEKIKKEIIPEALSVFQMIAYQCLNENSEKRPKAKEVVQQLKKALELQISYHTFSY
ncbi:uncharacterized protein [Rutidosis leptorrhynchoides]|uniref:uncharacterized protein n=1 Tax=Rutidosis leptorrhynchoides TaxID=125765 RepID=UPI003A9A2E57